MDENEFLAERFEAHRGHLRAVAYRMLGSLSEADDAVQEAWLRLSRSDTSAVENLGGWLTTIVARVSLNMLRSRTSRREDPLDIRLPDPVVSPSEGLDPEHQALLVDSVGLAMLVVLEALEPAERLAFVLHDMFAVPFDEIATVLERSPAATRQLASRARRRVQGMNPAPATNVSHQREIVEAFLAASQDGNFEALLEVLDPDVVLRADTGATAAQVIRGARQVAGRAVFFRQFGYTSVRVLVNGAAGIVSVVDGQPRAVLGFTIAGDRIVELDILADPKRLSQLDLQITLN